MIDRTMRARGDHTPPDQPYEQRWRLIDVIAMTFAALRVILPYLAVILLVTVAVFGLFMLAFG
jgi:hypothetical protein